MDILSPNSNVIEDIDRQNELAWTKRINAVQECFKISTQLFQESEKLNYSKGKADACRNLGYCYWRFSDYDKSLRYSLDAIRLYQLINDKKGVADALNNVGAVFMFQKKHKDRLEVNLQCLKIRTEIDDKDGVASSMNNIGETYLEMKDYENARLWFDQCIQYAANNNTTLAWAYFNLGKLSLSQNKLSEVLPYLEKSLSIAQSINYSSLLIEIYYQIAYFYFIQKDIEKCWFYIDESFKEAQNIGNKEGMALAQLLMAEVCEYQKNFEKALHYYKKYLIIKEEILNEVNLKNIQNLEFQYAVEKLKKEAEFQELKNKIIEQKNKDIMDSITYASRIQRALITSDEYIQKHFLEESYFQNYFILYIPKDIVSGDFYWANVNYLHPQQPHYIAVCDSTGHGVPGAFMSLLNINYLTEAVQEKQCYYPNEILNYVRKKLIENLNYDEQQKDGMDASIILFDKTFKQTQKIFYALANQQMILIRKNQLPIIIKGDKMPVGLSHIDKNFTHCDLELQKDDWLYLYTDGYKDQFGANDGKRFLQKRFVELIHKISGFSSDEQKTYLYNFFMDWKKDEPQTDDITVFGIQI